VARKPDGRIFTHKLLSHNPERYRDAALAGIRHFLQIAETEPIPAERVQVVKWEPPWRPMRSSSARRAHGAGRHPRLRGRASHRVSESSAALRPPHRAPELLYSRVIEARERVATDGTVLEALDAASVAAALRAAHDDGFRAWPSSACTAIAIRARAGHRRVGAKYRLYASERVARGEPAHEDRAAEIPRWSTPTLSNLAPLRRRRRKELRGDGNGVRLMFMQSSGGLADARRFRGKDAVLSGPAGGIVACPKRRRRQAKTT